MDFVVSGQITAVFTPNQGVSQRTGQPWVSQSFLLCYEQGQYPKSVSFSVFGEDKIRQFAIQQGEQLTVHLNIEAKQGQKGYFNDISAWKVERGQIPQQQPMQQMPAQNPFPPQGQQMQQPMQQMQQAPAQNPFPQQPMQQQVQQPAPGAAPFPPQMQGQQPIQGTQQMPQQQAAPQGQSQQLPF